MRRPALIGRGRGPRVARFSCGLVFLVLAVVTFSGLIGCGRHGGALVGATPGKLAPPFSGRTLEGVALDSEGFLGRPLFLIYATSG